MKSWALSLGAWKQDRLLHRVVRNSSYLLVSNTLSAVLSILTARLLGASGFGVLGAITDFTANINRLFSFRMGDVVIKYAGEFQVKGEKRRSAAVVKAAALTEAASSVLAFLVLLVLAPLGARLFTEDVRMAPLIALYGLSILTNITTETSTAVLQLGNHYRSQALVNLAQSVITAGLIVYAYLHQAGILAILGAYLVGKAILGLSPMVLAIYWLPRMYGRDWWKASFSLLPPRRELVRYAMSTNLHGTLNMIGRDSEILWINLFLSPTVGGYYKVAKAIVNVLVMPIQPFIATTFPEITRTIAASQWERLKGLLKRITILSAAWTGAVALGLIVFGRPVLFGEWTLFGQTFSLYQAEYLPAYPVILILVLGYGVPNILFWNRSMLLAFGLPEYALKVGFWTTLAKTLLTILLVPAAGYLMEASLLSAYFIVSIALLVWRGLTELRKAEKQDLRTVPV
jgi:O-antigen/teichoic acid export membrane protein